MSIELRLTVTDDIVCIPEANRPEMSHDTEREIFRNSQQQIAQIPRLDKYTKLRLIVVETIRVDS
jgi:hypothetical protein